MANTKTHPGMFRCYEAALPDEPMFVILGRDPAGPATLEFWAQERVRQQKVHERDDQDRIKAAIDEAKDMATWRQQIMDYAAEHNEPPVWKLPRPFADDLPPVRETVSAPTSYDYYPDPDGDPVKVTPLSFTRMSELLDYATCYGEFDEHTPNGTISKHGEGMSSPMNDIRRNAIWVMKRFMGIIPEGTEPPEYDDTPKTPVAEVIVQGVVRVGGQDYSIEHLERILAGQSLPKGLHNPKDKERIAELEGEIAALKITKDSEPEDLAHAPEVPHHRFSVFHTSGDYAYARGLEVNPMHLPTALDAMAKSGWHLCAIFGQTDAQHIGFIFRREVERFSAFEIAHGFGGGFPATAPAVESEEFKRFKSGEPLDEIREKRFTVHGLDPETTHYRNAEWTGDPEKLIKALSGAKPEVLEKFLRDEKVTSIAHYWRVASVGSLIRLIRLLDWQDRINLLSPISAEMVQKVLNCGGEGQEPCPDWGRGLAI